MTRTHICVATLGGQPQVVTLALDALLEHGYPIGEVFVIHLSTRNPHYRDGLERLAAEFAGGCYAGRPCRYQPRPVRLGAQLIDDLHGDEETDAAIAMFNRLIQELKREDATVHLCLSGGRRLLGMLALSAALLYFEQSDRIWHLYSSDAVRRQTAGGAIMHLPRHPDVRLVRVQLPPWGQYFPALRAAPEAGADAVRAAQIHAAEDVERARCHEVYERLTARQREVLRLLAGDLTPQDVADRLHIAIATVHTHKTTIFQECTNAWALPNGTRLSADWLRRRFAPFLDAL
ncbi:MAG: CRISPR-associated ring nuclease [Roseiflexaceae bacterium]